MFNNAFNKCCENIKDFEHCRFESRLQHFTISPAKTQTVSDISLFENKLYRGIWITRSKKNPANVKFSVESKTD